MFQLLFIRAGKAAKTIKEEGLLLGGKRVLSAFFGLFRFVGSGDILFVTGGVGDSARYRTQNVAEELENHGFKCSITVQDNPFILNYAGKFSVFIFHRVLFTPGVAKFVELLKKQGKEIIFETDDLVYDPKYLEHMDYFKVMNALEKKLYENGVGGEILADSYVKVCTTTTSFLAEKLREFGKEIFIVPNKLSKKDVEVAKKIMGHKTWNMKHGSDDIQHKLENQEYSMPNVPGSMIKIGYFSGALSHNKDFATITEALLFLMEKYSNVELFLAGPLGLESALNKFSDRIKQLPYVPREKHFENIAGVDINIAPLEIGNPFCESKSELKFFEAAIVEVPTVAATTQPFREAIEDGVDGLVANGTSEWIEKLEKLILDKNLRKEMGKKAREKTLQKYTTVGIGNEQYYDYLRKAIKKI